AEAAVSALKQDAALAGARQVHQHRLVVLVEDLRAGGHAQHHGRAVRASAVLAGAAAPLLRGEMLLKAEVDQRVEIVSRFDDDVAAASAVAAVRAAELDEFLAPERQR